LGPLQFDWAIVEEAGKCYLSEIIGPLLLSRQALLIGDHHQLPPFRIKEAEKSLKYKMNKSSRIKSLNAEFNLAEWLTPFASIYDLLEDSGSTHQLQSQWRLPKSISDMIGTVFYGSRFEHPGWDNSRNLPIIEYPEMVWLDTPLGLRDNEFLERSGDQRSMMNHGEITLIIEALRKIDPEIASENVAILTPYNGQKYALIKKLESDPNVAIFSNRVHTVDEFQGKEADLILISLVRNNLHTIAGRRWGFLLDPPRLNVMFSRAKRQMIVVGCSDFVRQTGFDDESDHLLRVLNWIGKDGGFVSKGE
jgi:superfamily I DNA and/or RNA helicase